MLHRRFCSRRGQHPDDVGLRGELASAGVEHEQEAVRWGESSRQVCLGGFREFRRTPTSPKSDQFIKTGLLVTYDSQDRAALIEFAEPAAPHLAGSALLGISMGQLRDLLSERGLDSIAEEDAIVDPSWRISFYALDGVIVGVLLGE